MAKKKSSFFLKKLKKNDILITSDTIVWHKNKALGKPKTKKEAFNMIKSLENDYHHVISSICISTLKIQVVVNEKTKVYFDKIKDDVKYINVRYTPFCYMKGYEKHVCNHYQHIYDKYDWNKEIYGYDIDTSKSYTDNEKIDMAHDRAHTERLKMYVKPIDCLKCKYYNICDGVEKQVKDFVALPEPGEKITNVNYYRERFYE